MENFDQVLMNIKSYGGSMSHLLIQSGVVSVRLMIYLLRMARKRLLSYKFGTDYMNFLEKTKGSFTVYNIPLSEEHALMLKDRLDQVYKLEEQLVTTKNPIKKASLQKRIDGIRQEMPEIEQLKKLNIDLCVLPKINGHSNAMQVAIANKDGEIFKNWYVNHVSAHMGGGLKSMKELEVMTESNYSIQNLSIEGNLLEEAFADFKTLNINYSILPDLKIGDGQTQIAVANMDLKKLTAWYKMFQEKLLHEGVNVADMKEISPEGYVNTGSVDIDKDYIQCADKVYQDADLEYTKSAQDIFVASAVKADNAEEFFNLSNNISYEKVTINKETLVDVIDKDIFESLSEKGYFISKVPGTFGKEEMNMIIPNEHVFKTDQGQTYIAFLSRTESVPVYNVAEKKIERWDGKKLADRYDTVNRGLKKLERIKEKGYPDKLHQKDMAKQPVLGASKRSSIKIR